MLQLVHPSRFSARCLVIPKEGTHCHHHALVCGSKGVADEGGVCLSRAKQLPQDKAPFPAVPSVSFG